MSNQDHNPGRPEDIPETTDFDEKVVRRARELLHETPESVGPYRILERIGGGGMGEVFHAEQRTPIRREVALKFIKLGMDTKQVIARFEAERQALALMDHPNIAKVYDAGADDAGRPYFVMEYVKGKPITDYADQNHLTIAERLELFEQVCHAIQHAHHKGVIHRDLKPGNILVSTQDGKPHAKVIDFGIAKAVAQRLTDMTLFTHYDQFIGTPQYMSPEQAEGSVDIDTRTDVYSLGVMLYELLTGSTPFTGEEIRAAAIEKLPKMIVEVDPPKPSTRLSLNQPTLASLAASRRVEPKRLGMLVQGELDWIVMRAMEKDRKRRYATPTNLADDVRAHLLGDPVEAAPPSSFYKLQKFARRNRGPVIAAAAIGGALGVGVVGTTWGYLRAEHTARLERVARDEAIVARDHAELEAYIANLGLAQLAMENNNYYEARQHLAACPQSKRGWEWKFLNKRAQAIVASFGEGEMSGIVPGGDGYWQVKNKRILQTYDNEGRKTKLLFSGDADDVISSVKYSVDRSRIFVKGYRENTNRQQGPYRRWYTFITNHGDRIVGTQFIEPASSTSIDYGESITSSQYKYVLVRKDLHSNTQQGGIETVVELRATESNRLVGAPFRSRLYKRWGHLANPFEFDQTESLLVERYEEGIRLWRIDSNDRTLLFDRAEVEDAAFIPNAERILVRNYATKTCEILDYGGNLIGSPFDHVLRDLPSISSDGKHILTVTPRSVRLLQTDRIESNAAGREFSGEVIDAKFTDDNRVELVYKESWALFSLAGEPLLRSELHGSENWQRRLGNLSAIGLYGRGAALVCSQDGNVSGSSFMDASHGFFTLSESGDILHVSRLESFYSPCICRTNGATYKESIDRGLLDLELELMKHNRESIGDDRRVRQIQSRLKSETNGELVLQPNSVGANPELVVSDLVSGTGSYTISPDAKRIVVATQVNKLRIYDTSNWRQLASVKTERSIGSVEFMPDGTRLLVVGTNGEAEIWDASTDGEQNREWTERIREEKPAREYLNSLERRPIPNSQLRQAIRDDKSLSLLRKIVALELLALDQSRWEREANEFLGTVAGGLTQRGFHQKELVLQWLDRRDGPVEYIKSVKLVSERTREELLKRVAEFNPSAGELNDVAWDMVHRENSDRAEYELGLAVAIKANEKEPDAANIANTLGIAFYRVDQFEKCLDALRRSASLREPNDLEPSDQIFIAMAHAKLGDTEQTKKMFDEINRQALANPLDEEDAGFLKELKQIIGSTDTGIESK